MNDKVDAVLAEWGVVFDPESDESKGEQLARDIGTGNLIEPWEIYGLLKAVAK